MVQVHLVVELSVMVRILTPYILLYIRVATTAELETRNSGRRISGHIYIYTESALVHFLLDIPFLCSDY